MSTVDLNPLISIPPAALALIAGEARRRLVSYLHRWDHGEVLLRYLDAWLALQPNAVSLREGRARVLADHSRGDEAVAMLDVLDAERAPTATRRRLRMQALISAGRFAELDPLLDALAEDEDQAAYAWLLRGDLERARGRLDEAADAYMEAGARDPRSLAAVRRLAELALDQGDPEALAARLMR
ncbi:MAG: hypothetical protein HC822_05740 [Oscillochloris sp.]|nr:hypothetical protein [Oscillochloris sp.]